MAGSVSAGEAWVALTVKSDKLRQGLSDASRLITTTADKIERVENKLSPTLSVSGLPGVTQALEKYQSKVERVTQRVEADITRSLIAVKAALATATGAIRGAVDGLGRIGDTWDKMSARTGLSTEALGEYAYAAELSGASISDVERSLRHLQQTIGAAANGSAGAAKKIENLGLSLRDLIGLSPEQQLDKIAAAMADIPDPTLRAAAAVELFGRGGTSLLPMLSGGSAGLIEMRREAQKLGVSMSGEDSKAAAEYTDSLTRLHAAIQGVSLAIGNSLNRQLTTATNLVAGSLGAISKAIDGHRKLAAATGGTGAAIAGTVTALIGYNFIIPQVVAALATLRTAVVALYATISAHPIGAAVTALAALAAGTVAAASAYHKSSVQIKSDARELRDATQNALSSEDELIKSLTAAANGQSLAVDEYDRTKQIISQLVEKYGDFGASVDDATQSIVLQADALDRLNEARRNDVIEKTKQTIEEDKANIERLQKARSNLEAQRNLQRRDATQRTWAENMNTAFPFMTYNPNTETQDKKIQEIDKQISDAKKRIEDEQNYLENLLDGGDFRGGTASVEAGSVALKPESLPDITRYFEDFRRSGLSDLERQIEDIDAKAQGLISTLVEQIGGIEKLSDPVNTEYRDLIDQINEVAQAQKQQLIDDNAAKIAQQNIDAAQTAQKAWEDTAAAIVKQEQAWAQEQETAGERRIRTIREETAAYQQQLNKLLELERAKEGGVDQSTIERIQAASAWADQRASQQITAEISAITQRTAAGSTGVAITQKQLELGNIYKQINAGEATPELIGQAEEIKAEINDLVSQQQYTRLAETQVKLTEALDNLSALEAGGAATELIAAAQERYAGASGDYAAALREIEQLIAEGMTPAEVVGEDIESGIETLKQAGGSGTFSLADTQKLNSNDYERKIADNSAETVRQLRQLNNKQYFAYLG